MGRKRYSPEQIIIMLREAEVLLSQWTQVAEVCRKLGVTEQTYYRWQKEYGRMRVDQAKRLKELEQENARLKKLVADLSLEGRRPRPARSGGRQPAAGCFLVLAGVIKTEPFLASLSTLCPHGSVKV